ncbi:MAG: TonB-dependent receptor [Calditrichaeota bacterium]|nr:TonB-dependent receptor [Calditrichota bacterium]
MNRLALILPLLLLLSLQLKATVTLEGRLRDRTDGDAVAGALLSIDVLARLTTSDGQGAWQFQNLPPGSWVLRVHHLAYRDLEQVIHVGSAETPPLELMLEPRVLVLPELSVQGGGEPGVIQQDGPGRSHLRVPAGATEDLAELAAHFPGVRVIREGGAGAVATLSVDGSPAREVLVCVDGVPLNAGGSHAVDLNRLTLGPLESLEFRRGADPARGALAGVLNLVTRRRPDPRQRLDLEWVRPDARSLALGLQHRPGRGLLDAGLRFQRGNGRYDYTDPQSGLRLERRNTDSRRDAFSLGWRPDRGMLESVGLSWHRREGGIGDRIDLSDQWPLREEESNSSLQALFRKGPASSGRLWIQDDRRVTRGSLWGPREERERSIGLAMEHEVVRAGRVFQPGWRLEGRALTFDAEYRNDVLNARRDELRPVLWLRSSRLRLEAGLEGWRDERRLHAVPIALLEALQPLRATGSGPELGLWAQASQGARMPSFLERFPVGGTELEANPDLDPERFRQLTLGLRARIGTDARWVSAESGVSQRDARDLIVWRQSQAAAWKPFNLGQARIRQWYLSLQARPAAGWDWLGELRLADSRNRTPGINAGRYLPLRPLNEWRARLDWSSPGVDPWKLGLECRGAGRSFAGESNLDGLDAAALDPWWVLDLSLGREQRVRRLSWGWGLSLENLLDNEVRMVPKVPLPGRSLRLGVWLIHS